MKTEKIAFITGSTKGIGAAIASLFESKGYRVITNGRSKLNYRKDHLVADLSKEDSVAKIVEFFEKENLVIDVLVNNAAYTEFIPHADLDKITSELLDKMYIVNLKTPLMLTAALKPYMVRNANIINIASVAGINAKGSNIGYCALKAGLINITKSLARSLGPMRVNSISPGLILTDFVKFPDGYLEETIEKTPVGFAGIPEDVANLTYSIIEDMRYVSGHNFVIDGGRSLN